MYALSSLLRLASELIVHDKLLMIFFSLRTERKTCRGYFSALFFFVLHVIYTWTLLLLFSIRTLAIDVYLDHLLSVTLHRETVIFQVLLFLYFLYISRVLLSDLNGVARSNDHSLSLPLDSAIRSLCTIESCVDAGYTEPACFVSGQNAGRESHFALLSFCRCCI